MLVGLNGFKRVGKDTVGDYLVERYGFQRLKFAALLYESASKLFGIPVSLLEKYKDHPDATVTISFPEGTITLSFRQFLQRYGTEAHRDVFGQDFWVDQLLDAPRPYNIDSAEYHALTGELLSTTRYVITDARFENELRTIIAKGGYNIRIERDTEESDTHVSEEMPPLDLIHYFIDNSDSFEFLYDQVDEFMYQIGVGPVSRKVELGTLQGLVQLPL
jgi:hypothetical protein